MILLRHCNISAVVLFSTFFMSLTFGQSTDTSYYTTDEIVVSAGRTPITINEVPRSYTIITQEEIKNAPVENIQDLLGYYAGVDVKKRGSEGVQADVSIRGGSFEQTLILIDGIKLSDPQTGHNNMNLPINIGDVEKIEILNGQASTVFGPNALAGVINIITKKSDGQKLTLGVSGGENGYYRGSISAQLPVNDFDNLISVSRTKSDGYRHNTDFDIITAFAKSGFNFTSGKAGISIGYTDKAFGANSFYTTKYPNQWEHTKTLFTTAIAAYSIKNFTFTPKLSLRHNTDYYVLKYENPAFYKNDHTTNAYNIEFQTVATVPFGSFALTEELGFDDINSSNLGVHNRRKSGVAGEFISQSWNQFKLLVSGYTYNYTDFGWKFLPSVNLGFQVTEELNSYISYGKSFRVPTFTELYYLSPVQKGNTLLQPEEAATVEVGLNYTQQIFSTNLGLFSRKGTNLIDWIKETPATTAWHSENISHITTNGIEAGFSLFPSKFIGSGIIKRISVHYEYLDSKPDQSNFISLYALDHLKHQITAEITHYLPYSLSTTWVFRYEVRINQDPYFITDVKFSYNYQHIDLKIEAENLFNTSYLDLSGIPLAGRWVKAGVEYSFH